MRYFRSPLLAHIPVFKKRGRTGRITFRLLVVGTLSILFLSLILTLNFQLLPKEGLGYWLYWAHDHFYLPIKGYTFTLFYPTSLLWWGVAFTLFCLWLASFLLDRSLIRDSHIALLRRAVHTTRLHPLLTSSTRAFWKLGIQPRLLLAVTEHEYTKRINHLLEMPRKQVRETDNGILVGLTELLVDLLALNRSPDPAQVALYWQRALLLSQYHEHRQIATRLLQSIGPVVRPLLEAKDFTVSSLFEQTGGFDLKSILAESLLMGWWDDSAALKPLFGQESDILDRRRAEIRLRLVEAMDNRLASLDAIRRHLETRKSLDAIPSTRLSEANASLPAQGSLSLGVAIQFAVLSDKPGIALKALDSIEALNFILLLAEDENKTIQRLRTMYSHLPQPEHYRLCAELDRTSPESLRHIARGPLVSRSGLLTEGDFVWEASQVASLDHATGPLTDPTL